MKSTIIKGVLLGSIMTLVISCNSKKEEIVIDKNQIKEEIQAIENEFAKHYNDRSAESITYYADDATSFTNDNPPFVGIKSIKENFKKHLLNFPKGDKISLVTKEIFVSIDANQVVEVGKYITVDSTNVEVSTGNYIALFEKRNGKYLCVRDMASNDVLPEDVLPTEE